MIIGNTIAGRFEALDPALLAALPKLEFLVVTDFYADTPLGRLADVVLPMAMSMEKDGTFTSFDRTVQRLRAAVPPMGEAKDGIDIFSRIARRMGYGMTYRGPAQVAGRDRQTRSRLWRDHLRAARAARRARSGDLVHRRRNADSLAGGRWRGQTDTAGSFPPAHSARPRRTGDHACLTRSRGFRSPSSGCSSRT